jgi:hypothetical protein
MPGAQPPAKYLCLLLATFAFVLRNAKAKAASALAQQKATGEEKAASALAQQKATGEARVQHMQQQQRKQGRQDMQKTKINNKGHQPHRQL